MSETTIVVPMPPSANNLWTISQTRDRFTWKRKATLVRTINYKEWLSRAVPIIRTSMVKFQSPVRTTVTIRGGQGWDERRDIDNCLKAVQDALVAAKRINDDSCLNVIHCEVIYLLPLEEKPACCWLTVREVSYADYTIDDDSSEEIK